MLVYLVVWTYGAFMITRLLVSYTIEEYREAISGIRALSLAP